MSTHSLSNLIEELIEIDAGDAITIRENGSLHEISVDRVEDRPPEPRQSGEISVSGQADGTPWSVAIAYEWDGLEERVPLRTLITRASKATITEGWAWQPVEASIADIRRNGDE